MGMMVSHELGDMVETILCVELLNKPTFGNTYSQFGHLIKWYSSHYEYPTSQTKKTMVFTNCLERF